MSGKTMANVLAEHRLDVTMYIGTGQEHLCICGNRSDSQDQHQSDELTGAGFGDVRGAGAKALEDAADELARLPYAKPDALERPEYERLLAVRRGDTDKWLRARAAAVRGEG